ncbi:hypothetical protein BB561_005859, partial [Smittium simulii]
MPRVPGVIPSAAAGVPLTPAKRTRLEYSTVAKTGYIDPASKNDYNFNFPAQNNQKNQKNEKNIKKYKKLKKNPFNPREFTEVSIMHLLDNSIPKALKKSCYSGFNTKIGCSWSGIMAINCSTDITFKIQNQLIPSVKEYKYLGIEFNHKWNNKAFFKAKKIKTFKSYMGCYSILKRNDMPTKFKVMVIKAIIQAVATYGGELFGMSATRCKPIQQVVDAATRTLAKCGKSAAMVRLRQELSLTGLNIKTAVARTRAFGKWTSLRTWISDLIKCPYKHRCDTW